MSESPNPTPSKHICPVCQQSYNPTAAVRNFRRLTELGADVEKWHMKSITYYGQCPNGHAVCETVEA